MKKFAIIDIEGKVWGPYTAPYNLASHLGLREAAIVDRIRCNTDVKRIRAPFIATIWAGEQFSDYDVPPIEEWRKSGMEKLPSIQEGLTNYKDPSDGIWYPYKNSGGEFSIIDYGGQVFGPFTNRTGFERRFGMTANIIGRILSKEEPERLFYSKVRPFFVVNTEVVEKVLPLPEPSKKTKQDVALQMRKLPEFRKKMKRYVAELRGEVDYEDDYKDLKIEIVGDPFKIVDKTISKTIEDEKTYPKDKYGWCVVGKPYDRNSEDRDALIRCLIRDWNLHKDDFSENPETAADQIVQEGKKGRRKSWIEEHGDEEVRRLLAFEIGKAI